MHEAGSVAARQAERRAQGRLGTGVQRLRRCAFLGNQSHCFAERSHGSDLGGHGVYIADHMGKVLPNGFVHPGVVVAATMYANHVYNGVGGDKF
jgi:hypothetical protein